MTNVKGVTSEKKYYKIICANVIQGIDFQGQAPKIELHPWYLIDEWNFDNFSAEEEKDSQ